MVTIHFLRLELKTGRNFEAVQSYLGLFLKIHGETVAEEEVNVLLTLTYLYVFCFQFDVPAADARAGDGGGEFGEAVESSPTPP